GGRGGGAASVGDPREGFEGEGAGERGTACDDELGAMLPREVANLVEVYTLRVPGDTIGHDSVEAAREVDGTARSEVTAVGQIGPQHGIAGLEEGEVHRHVGLRARVWLNVHVLGAEELFGAVDGEI